MARRFGSSGFILLLIATGCFSFSIFSGNLAAEAKRFWPFFTLNGNHQPKQSLQTDQPLQVLNEINALRFTHNLPPLRLNTQLNQAAQHHAAFLARTQQVSHTGAQGSRPPHRLTQAGYAGHIIGENLANGQRTAREVVRDWLASATHRRNLLNPQAREIGVGQIQGYWVLDLAKPL